jgi:hypothetical protein
MSTTQTAKHDKFQTSNNTSAAAATTTTTTTTTTTRTRNRKTRKSKAQRSLFDEEYVPWIDVLATE